MQSGACGSLKGELHPSGLAMTIIDDRIARRRKLIIAGFEPLDQSSHWFNELASFKTDSGGLGLAVRIIVLRSTEPVLGASLSADAVLEPLPAMEVKADNFVGQVVTFGDAAAMQPLWAQLDAEKLGGSDLIYFPRGHPILIRGVGWWLEEQPPERRPNIFFRIIGDELTDPETGRFKPRAAFYRLACADLRGRPGQERVFFLVNSAAKARSVSRVCWRRPFMMQHHFGRVVADVPAPVQVKPVVYVHLNSRSGRLAANLGDIIRRVVAVEPSAKFLIRLPRESSQSIAALESDIGSSVEMLPREQSMAEYLANLARCTLVLLAYEAQPYKVLTSGVFTEAASLGKPVVVPAGTWMAEKIAEGYGVGMAFESPAAGSVADALAHALRNSDRLGATARAIAPRLGEETGCRRFIERMMALAAAPRDMEPRYRVGDEIDFSDALDSRGFMQMGWGETEPWGVWTVGRHAELTLRLETDAGPRLILNALAFAFLGRRKTPVCVCVSVAGRKIAEWVFEMAGPQADQPRWLTALLPPHAGEYPNRTVDISFEVDAPTSPFAEGISGDRRTLGLGLCKLLLTSAQSDLGSGPGPVTP
jgi:glycosyltransferase involved in cell wall biosynthesis